jgi:L,D-peptidoglycan transpeptidase YkuD (ErfK/YbiS/YcfS/YnhG family)
VIEYNTDPIVPGKGSAIFMHIWRGPDSPTSGCIAMAKENFLPLLKWLNWDHNPVIILKNPSPVAQQLENLVK